MKRNVDFNEISDGKRYGLEDMVRADCAGCAGCSACCMGMGNTVVLDPFDVHRLVTGTGLSLESLLQKHLELNVVDGVILPNLKMAGEKEACAFLNEEVDAVSTHTDRESVACFLWGEFMKMARFTTFCRFTNVRKAIALR